MGNLFTLCSGKRSEEENTLNPKENNQDSKIILKEFTEKPEVQTNELRMNRIHPIQMTYESNSKIDADIGRRFGF